MKSNSSIEENQKQKIKKPKYVNVLKRPSIISRTEDYLYIMRKIRTKLKKYGKTTF